MFLLITQHISIIQKELFACCMITISGFDSAISFELKRLILLFVERLPNVFSATLFTLKFQRSKILNLE